MSRSERTLPDAVLVEELWPIGVPRLFLEQVIRLGRAMARRGHGGRPSKGDRDQEVLPLGKTA